MSEAKASTGRILQDAVARWVDDSASVIRFVEEIRRTVPPHANAERLRIDLKARVIDACARRAAFSGGTTALPALLPGIGALFAITGGALADMALLLKYEVEMALALAHIDGFDIANERNRQLAFLLGIDGVRRAGNPADAQPGEPALDDVFRTYGVREIERLIGVACARVALLSVGKGIARALPLLGVAVGASVNRALTRRVGQRIANELERRRELSALLDGAPENVLDVDPVTAPRGS